MCIRISISSGHDVEEAVKMTGGVRGRQAQIMAWRYLRRWVKDAIVQRGQIEAFYVGPETDPETKVNVMCAHEISFSGNDHRDEET